MVEENENNLMKDLFLWEISLTSDTLKKGEGRKIKTGKDRLDKNDQGRA